MLSQEEIDAFKNEGYTFEEINHIQEGLKDIEFGKIYTMDEVEDYIENELFGKYKIHA